MRSLTDLSTASIIKNSLKAIISFYITIAHRFNNLLVNELQMSSNYNYIVCLYIQCT